MIIIDHQNHHRNQTKSGFRNWEHWAGWDLYQAPDQIQAGSGSDPQNSLLLKWLEPMNLSQKTAEYWDQEISVCGKLDLATSSNKYEPAQHPYFLCRPRLAAPQRSRWGSHVIFTLSFAARGAIEAACCAAEKSGGFLRYPQLTHFEKEFPWNKLSSYWVITPFKKPTYTGYTPKSSIVWWIFYEIGIPFIISTLR